LTPTTPLLPYISFNLFGIDEGLHRISDRNCRVHSRGPKDGQSRRDKVCPMRGRQSACTPVGPTKPVSIVSAPASWCRNIVHNPLCSREDVGLALVSQPVLAA